jgi:hypothetical protein
METSDPAMTAPAGAELPAFTIQNGNVGDCENEYKCSLTVQVSYINVLRHREVMRPAERKQEARHDR